VTHCHRVYGIVVEGPGAANDEFLFEAVGRRNAVLGQRIEGYIYVMDRSIRNQQDHIEHHAPHKERSQQLDINLHNMDWKEEYRIFYTLRSQIKFFVHLYILKLDTLEKRKFLILLCLVKIMTVSHHVHALCTRN